jgi:hypothetical protein
MPKRSLIPIEFQSIAFQFRYSFEQRILGSKKFHTMLLRIGDDQISIH